MKMKLKTCLLLITSLTLFASGCTPTATPAEPADLHVFAAASLSEPFSEMGRMFETEHPGVKAVFNFAGSQQLAQQINEGAPADVFASANNRQMDLVIDADGIISGTQQTFARNQLVVIYPKDNPAGVNELKELARPGLKLVLAAKEVPVGGYTQTFLEKASADPAFGVAFKDEVLKNVASYEDNVKAVLTKVALGEADAGIVYLSDISGADADKVGQMDIPEALNVMATYPIAPVMNSKNQALAQAFIDLVVSARGQEILAKYNFLPVK
jgi:molybdate transport system substrate-binding protein